MQIIVGSSSGNFRLCVSLPTLAATFENYKNGKASMNLYYRIWVDGIIRLKSFPKNKENWQLKSMAAMSIGMTFNFALFMAILQRNVLGYYFYKLDLTFLPEREGNAVSFIALFLVPCLVINYLLIFRKRRYEKLLKKYPNYNGKLFMIYFSISLFLPIALILNGIVFTRF